LGELSDRLARGEAAAFAEFYDACADRLRHYLVVRLGSHTDADDVLQETFVRLARARQKLLGVENVAASRLRLRGARQPAGRRDEVERSSANRT
jgi:DNA-directed RNA polymerase specialized sigma24 family protein